MTRADPTNIADEPIVVIGSGPSGAVAAHRLVERGCDVVMLDSGRSAPKGIIVRAAGNTMFRKMGSSDMTGDRLAPGSSASTVWHSSLSHGGLSNFWTSAVPRFHPEDFTEGARLDERYRWPVTYDELVPYYEQAEQHLGITADEPIDGVPPNVLRHRQQLPPDWRELVHRIQEHGDGAGAIPLAKGEPWMIALRGTEFSSYHCVVRPLVASGRLRLLAGAHVLRLIWSGPAGRVVAVEYADRNTRTVHQIRVRGVVLAAGTIDTTMILLRSTSDEFPDGLGNTHDLVGRYLHDHPREWWPGTLARPMRALAHPVYLARRPHDISDPLLSTSHTIGLSAPKQRLRTYVRGSSSTIGVQVFGTMVPKPERGVEIDREASATPDQRPMITLRYDDAEVANIHSSPRATRRSHVESRHRPHGERAVPRPPTRVVGPHGRHGADARRPAVRRPRPVDANVRRTRRRGLRHERVHDGPREEPHAHRHGTRDPRCRPVGRRPRLSTDATSVPDHDGPNDAAPAGCAVPSPECTVAVPSGS